MRKTKFDDALFTATEWEGAKEKARFADHFVRFVEGGFKPTLFPDWFYRRLSNTFGHIAHYDRVGFYATWFEGLPKRAAFLRHALRHHCCGDPAFTYSDVERALQSWIRESGWLEKIEAADRGARDMVRNAALDAGNRSMRNGGRAAWNADDFDAATGELARLSGARP
jgi:hypothetical protein